MLKYNAICHFVSNLKLLFFAAILMLPQIAHTCVISAPTDLHDLLFADAIVVGRVLRYEVIDVGGAGPLPNYAIFTMRNGEPIYGELPNSNGNLIQFTWDNSTFGEPETWNRTDTILVSLRNSTSEIPPLRGPSATILPAPYPNLMTVLQAPCAGAFIFRDDDIIRAIKLIFDGKGDQQTELDIFAEYFYMNGNSQY